MPILLKKNAFIYSVFFVILACLLFGHLIPSNISSFSYSLSLSIQKVLISLLPFIVFSFLFHTMHQIQKGTANFVILLFTMVCLSNFTNTWISYLVGKIFFHDTSQARSLITALSIENTSSIKELWHFGIPKIISNDIALIAGFILGWISNTLFGSKGREIATRLDNLSLLLLKKGFIPILPLFISGFVLKFQSEESLSFLLQEYIELCIIIIASLTAYIFLLFSILYLFRIKKIFMIISKIFPSIATGFSSMSSAVAMPFLMNALEKQKDGSVAKSVLPVVINIHLVGDCVAIPLIAFFILQNHGIGFPDIQTYFYFSIFFVINKFAIASVPAGGIIVMLPILSSYLGFNHDMLSSITTIYILFDCLITSFNLFGNSLFVLMFDKIYRKIS